MAWRRFKLKHLCLFWHLPLEACLSYLTLFARAMTAVLSLSPGCHGVHNTNAEYFRPAPKQCETVLVVSDLDATRGIWAPNDGAEVKGATVQLKMIPATTNGTEGCAPHATAAAVQVDDSGTDTESGELWQWEQEASAAVHAQVWSKLNSGGDGAVEWLQGSITFEAEGSGRTSHYIEPCELAFGAVDWERVQRRRAEFHACRSRSPRRSLVPDQAR
jgi:hypothetical protein